jgi:hypothetical protein
MVIALFVATCALLAQGKPSGMKSCEELKQEIDAKLKAKGVKAHTLEIVAADQVKDQKVVGSCEGGKKKITYARQRGAASATKKSRDTGPGLKARP